MPLSVSEVDAILDLELSVEEAREALAKCDWVVLWYTVSN